jgi:hypothetical protein
VTGLPRDTDYSLAPQISSVIPVKPVLSKVEGTGIHFHVIASASLVFSPTFHVGLPTRGSLLSFLRRQESKMFSHRRNGDAVWHVLRVRNVLPIHLLLIINQIAYRFCIFIRYSAWNPSTYFDICISVLDVGVQVSTF